MCHVSPKIIAMSRKSDAKTALLENTDRIVWKPSISDLIAQAFEMYNYSVPVAVLRDILDNQ